MSLKPIYNELNLLEKVIKGDEKAFEELFMSYHNQLGAYVQMITQSNEMTEEIVQDVFLKVWTNRGKLHQVEKFTSYLFILTRNYTLNALRKMLIEHKHKTAYLVQAELDGTYTSLENAAVPVDDFQFILDKALIQLPPQQQKVFLLRMQGFKNPEIALEMDLATDSVKKYFKLALETIKRHCNNLKIIKK